MTTERRHYPRQRLNDPELFDMADNGGILVDVSEQGLGFQLVSPVKKNQPLSFSFSLGSNRLMPASACVVWTSRDGKTGGMKFTSLPEDTRGQIQKWLEVPAPEIRTAANAAPLPLRAAVTTAEERPNLSPPPPPFPPRDLGNVFSRSSWIARQSEAKRSHRGFGALILIALFVVAGITAARIYPTHRQQIMAEIAEIKKSLAGPAETRPTPAPQPQTPVAEAPAPRPSPAPPDPFSVAPARPVKKSPSLSALSRAYVRGMPGSTAAPSRARERAMPEAAEKKLPAASAKPISTDVEGLGRNEFLRGENYLSGKGTPHDPVQAARWFWAALGDGYTPATIPLADMYLRGEGVSRSCVQARVLLTAAARKKNADAIRRLAQLPESCD